MMGRTDRHFRYLLRLLAPDLRLYTEMLTAHALVHGDTVRYLAYNESEHPVALQLGGNDPGLLAQAARMGADHGYDEINLNIGCPSDRVSTGDFGACLMDRPQLVAECVAEIRAHVDIPVSVKTRCGIDDQDNYEFVAAFLTEVAAAGCQLFILHARKAILAGLSPAENRHIPPLRYPLVYRLAREFPKLRIILNGGIRSSREVREHLPGISKWAEWCYASPSRLLFDGAAISSEVGCQQGDPLGPLLFSMAIQPILMELAGIDGVDLMFSYLDDCCIAGECVAVAGAME
ncbi:MAG: tRNA dihydrouridine(20/20a) synthase DusA, partial [Gammaproteobacteria bacterium]|nr:tRNA dihydrouridine(20/20a) synthase DusA [Gammaproteobacteria bacterium]